MTTYVRLGAILIVAWTVLWLGLKIVTGVVHLLFVAGVALLVVGLVRRGARAVQRRT